jgi:hypothetical protein
VQAEPHDAALTLSFSHVFAGSPLVFADLRFRLTGLFLTRGSPRPTWPFALKVAVSIVLALHLAAITSAHLSSSPSSAVEQRAASLFKPYNDLINQGYGYRYYARLDLSAGPDHRHPWGTPVVLLEMEFDGPGQEVRKESVRLPELSGDRLWPRLRHQRQLDLAYHLSADTRWAASYARHLCKTRRCDRVTVVLQKHQIPDLALVRAAAAGTGEAIDLEAESTYGPRSNLGEFPCTNF